MQKNIGENLLWNSIGMKKSVEKYNFTPHIENTPIKA